MPDAPFDAQQVLVTVPASFDAVARELTLKAAEQAGYRNLAAARGAAGGVLCVDRAASGLARAGRVGDLILVVDIGGGTTDFTLIAVTEQAGELQLERVAVGEHILLGGDNIDLALARHLEQQLGARRARSWMRCSCTRCGSNAAWPRRSCSTRTTRSAKQPVTILGRGTGLVGGTIKTKLLRERYRPDPGRGLSAGGLEQGDAAAARRMGLRKSGCPMRPTRPSRATWRDSCGSRRRNRNTAAVRADRSGLACPTHVLFNGGVLRAGLVRERILEVLNGWLAEEGLAPVKPLVGEDLMHAVARGAAYYGLARDRQGRAHSRRRAAHLLCRHRKRHARGARHAGAVEGADGGAVRHGGRHVDADLRGPRVRPGGRASRPSSASSNPAARKNDAAGALIEDVRRRSGRAVARGSDSRRRTATRASSCR